MTASIARYLKDFGEPHPAAPLLTPEFDIGGMVDDFDFPEVEEEPKIDVAAERAEAYAEGYEAGSAEFQKKWAEEKQILEEAYATEMAALRERYEVQAVQAIEAGLNSVATSVAAVVSEQTADILVPFLGEALGNKAIEELADMIRKAMLDGDIGTITVSGPHDMFARLQATLGADAPLLRHVEANDLDLCADIDGSVLVTRMSAWAASLRKVLG